MKRYEIEELHEKLFGYNAFEDLSFGEKASEVQRYINENGYPKFDDYGNLIDEDEEEDERFILEYTRRNTPMTITTGQWEDLMAELKELKSIVNKLK